VGGRQRNVNVCFSRFPRLQQVNNMVTFWLEGCRFPQVWLDLLHVSVMERTLWAE